MPYWWGQRGQKKMTGCSQHSSFSTIWCLCLHSTEQYSLVGEWPTADHEMHPDSTATPSLTEKDKEENIEWNGWMSTGDVEADAPGINQRVKSRTLDGFGVFLDLTVGCATHHIPHYDLPRGISGSQTQTVGWADVVVVVFSWPFHLQNHNTHMYKDCEFTHHRSLVMLPISASVFITVRWYFISLLIFFTHFSHYIKFTDDYQVC